MSPRFDHAAPADLLMAAWFSAGVALLRLGYRLSKGQRL